MDNMTNLGTTHSRISGRKPIIMLLAVYLLLWTGSQVIVARWIQPDNLAYLFLVVFSILFSVAVLLLGCCLGWKIKNLLKIPELPPILEIVISATLGLGVLASLIFILALSGLVQPIALLVIFGILSILCADTVYPLNTVFKEIGRGITEDLIRLSLLQKIVLILVLLGLAAGFIQALTPPFDYDGLGYHLQNPRLIIAAGKISPMPENWLTYYPSLYEMLFLAGMVFQTDIAAKISHFIAYLLLLGAMIGFTRQLFNRRIAFLAIFFMAGIPILPIWASLAYVDLAWSLFQFMAIGMVLLWVRQKSWGLLFCAGLFQGMALANKYLSFTGAVLLGLIVLWESWRSREASGRLKHTIMVGAIFAGGAILIAAPWYIKNWLWTGDPLFPLLFKTKLVDPSQIGLWVSYMQSFGVHQGWLGYLTLPLQLVFNYRAFGTFLGGIDLPHPLFLCFPLLIWSIRKESADGKKTLGILAYLIAGLFFVWIFNSQQLRFLLPAYPLLSIVCTQALYSVWNLPKTGKFLRALSLIVLTGMTLITTVIAFNALITLAPYRMIIGSETRTDFLGRMVNNFHAQEYITSHLTSTDRAFMPWDARGYYCDQRCLADIDQMGWATIVKAHPSIESLKSELQARQITHLLLSQSDADYFVTAHDTGGVHSNAYQFTTQKFLPVCSSLIYQNANSRLYKFDFSLATCK
jgi:hypothetical protein